MKRFLLAFLLGTIGFATAVVISAVHGSGNTATAANPPYLPPPANGNGVTLQWAWQIGSPFTASELDTASVSTANIIDTDDFDDANSLGSNDEPSGPSSTVAAIHASGKYSVCYIEAGAQQAEPDSSHFAAADDGSDAKQYQMQGWPGEYWFDTRGFAGYKYGDSDSVLTGAAPDIAAGMAQRIAGCKTEGQDAIEPDDLDGYTNPGDTGVAGGGWGLTQADAAGYEAWLATTAHADGLAIFQKNDGANTATDEPYFDGFIIEECNYYDDPCTGASGDDANLYVAAGKPVLNAEYSDDGETTAKFCPADEADGLTGALFNVDLDGKTSEPCVTGSGYTYPGNGGTSSQTSSTASSTVSSSSTLTSSTTSSTPSSTSTSSSSSSTTPTSTSTTSTSTTVSSTSTSPPPPPPPAKVPVNTKAPKLSGTAKQGDQLKTTDGTWTGASSYTYQWARCKSTCKIVGNAKKQTYSLGSGDVDYRIEAIVTAHSKAGSAAADSNESSVVVPKGKQPRAVAARKEAA